MDHSSCFVIEAYSEFQVAMIHRLMVTLKLNNVVPAASMLRPVWGEGGGGFFFTTGEFYFQLKGCDIHIYYVLYKFMCIVQLKRGFYQPPPPPPPPPPPDAAQHAHAIKEHTEDWLSTYKCKIDKLRHYNCGNFGCFRLCSYIFLYV